MTKKKKRGTNTGPCDKIQVFESRIWRVTWFALLQMWNVSNLLQESDLDLLYYPLKFIQKKVFQNQTPGGRLRIIIVVSGSWVPTDHNTHGFILDRDSCVNLWHTLSALHRSVGSPVYDAFAWAKLTLNTNPYHPLSLLYLLGVMDCSLLLWSLKLNFKYMYWYHRPSMLWHYHIIVNNYQNSEHILWHCGIVRHLSEDKLVIKRDFGVQFNYMFFASLLILFYNITYLI